MPGASSCRLYRTGRGATLILDEESTGYGATFRLHRNRVVASSGGTRPAVSSSVLTNLRLISLVALISGAALTTVPGCVDAADPEDGATESFTGDGKADLFSHPITAPQACGILRAANEATLTQLDDEAGLSSRAAQNIVQHREGSCPPPCNAGGDLYDTLDELDAVRYVGPVAAQHLLDYATAQGFIASCGAPACVPGSWASEPELGFPYGAREPYLLVDSAGRQHVMFLGFTGGAQRYFYTTRLPGGEWGPKELVFEPTVRPDVTGDAPSFALAPDGTVYFAFAESPNLDYRTVIVHRDSTGHFEVNRPVALQHALFPRLAVDDRGIHIAFYELVDGFRYASQPFGGAWSVETVDPDAQGAHSALSIRDGIVHAVFEDSTQRVTPFGSTRYARRSASGTWTSEIAVRDASHEHLAIAADGAGNVHVASMTSFGKISYLRRTPAGLWTENEVDTDAARMLRPKGISMALDAGGGVHLAYATLNVNRDGAMKYAVRSPITGSWEVSTLAGIHAPVNHNESLYAPASALATDGSSSTHLVYEAPPASGDRKLRTASTCDGW